MHLSNAGYSIYYFKMISFSPRKEQEKHMIGFTVNIDSLLDKRMFVTQVQLWIIVKI